MQDTLGYPTDDLRFTQIRGSFEVRDYRYSEGSGDGVVSVEEAVCSDESFVALYLQNMLDEEDFDGRCGGVVWRTFTCAEQFFACVNCINSCRNNPNNCLPTSAFLLNPCGNQCDDHIAKSAVLSFQYALTAYYPRIRRIQLLNVAERMITLGVNLSLSGSVSCVAYTSSTAPLSTVAMATQVSLGLGAASTVSFDSTLDLAVIELYPLLPQTEYDVYCYTTDFAGHIMPLIEVLESVVPVTTSCCARVSLALNALTLAPYPPYPSSSAAPSTENDQAQKEPQHVVGLSVPPALHTITVTMTVQSVACDGQTEGTGGSVEILPSPQFTFYSNSEFNDDDALESSYQYQDATFVLRGKTAGCYVIQAQASAVDGVPGSEYLESGYLPANASFMIREYGEVSDPPVLKGVRFSDVGNNLVLVFDSNTDKGATRISSFDSSFLCDVLISFPDSSVATCQWQSASTILALLPYDTTVVVGDACSLRSNMLLPAQGGSDYSPTGTGVKIEPPHDPIRPQVRLSSTTEVSTCDDLELDPTQSYGSAGREWTAVEWDVTVEDTSAVTADNLENLNHVLNSEYGSSTARLAVVARRYLILGTSYTFRLKLTNHLGRSNAVAVTVAVQNEGYYSPKLLLVGPTPPLLYAENSISIFADASYPSCITPPSQTSESGSGSGSGATPLLNYQWKVYVGAKYMRSIVSVSSDPRFFRLPQYSLDSMTVYIVQATVTLTTALAGAGGGGGVSVGNDNTEEVRFTTKPATSSLRIQISKAGVQASIRGATVKTVSASSGFSLDATDSRDLDVKKSASFLRYEWTCRVISADFGSQCNGFDYADRNIVLLVPPYNIEAGTYNITLTVTNYNMVRHSAYVIITVLDAILPVVEVENSGRGKINPLETVVLRGYMDGQSRANDPGAIYARWSSPYFHNLILNSPTGLNITAAAVGSITTFQLSFSLPRVVPGGV